MESLLLRTNAALQDCERHLSSSNAFGTEIESYLTQYLLVVLCADVQQEMYRITEQRAAMANDGPLAAYVSNSARRILRSISKKEIAAFVEMFGPEYKAMLNAKVDDAEVTIYSNAVGGRHDVAHNYGTGVTFSELKKAVAIAEKLLFATQETLWPTPPAPIVAVTVTP